MKTKAPISPCNDSKHGFVKVHLYRGKKLSEKKINERYEMWNAGKEMRFRKLHTERNVNVTKGENKEKSWASENETQKYKSFRK